MIVEVSSFQVNATTQRVRCDHVTRVSDLTVLYFVPSYIFHLKLLKFFISQKFPKKCNFAKLC